MLHCSKHAPPSETTIVLCCVTSITQNFNLRYMVRQDDASVLKMTLKGKVSTRSFEGSTDVGLPYLFQV